MKHAKIIITAIIVMSMFACSNFNKLLKSDDVDKKYAEALRLYYKRDYKRASTLFENIMPNIYGSSRDDTVLFYLGNSLFNTKNYEMAAEMMDAYRNRFSRAPFTEEAEYLYAMSFYLTSGDPERDQTSTNQAILAFNEFLNRHPESEKAEDIKFMIEEMTYKLYTKRFLNSSLYYKLSYYKAAITALRNTLKDNPEMPQREEMMYLICKSWFDYARGSVQGRQLDRYLSMIDSYLNFKSEYPNGSKYDKELLGMYNYAQDFADKHGTQARELERNILSIEDRQRKIADNKELIFETDNPDTKDRLRQEIKQERATIREERKVVKLERKALELSTRREKPQKLRSKEIKKESVSFEQLEKEGTEQYTDMETVKTDYIKEIKKEGKLQEQQAKKDKQQARKDKRQK